MAAKDVNWAEIIDAEMEPQEIIRTIAQAALNAENYTKGEAVVPDYRTRLAAAQTLLMHRRGKPSEAPADPKAGSEEAGKADLLSLLEDPEYAARVEAALAAAKKRRGKSS